MPQNPPTDGKDEESIDFKTMIHGIHAAAMRENALQVVGFRGFTTYVYDEEHVHYPGDLSNCTTCHVDGGFTRCRWPTVCWVPPLTRAKIAPTRPTIQ